MAMETSLNKKLNEQSNGVYVPSSTKQQSEMTKFCIAWRMWMVTAKFLWFSNLVLCAKKQTKWVYSVMRLVGIVLGT